MAEISKQKLLARGLSKNTVKVQLVYLSGLWTSLSEARGEAQTFKGLPASVRLTSGEVDKKSLKEGSFIFGELLSGIKAIVNIFQFLSLFITIPAAYLKYMSRKERMLMIIISMCLARMREA